MTCELTLEGEDGDHKAGGLVAAAARVLNAIPAVCAAKPGLLSPLDLPQYSARGLLARGAAGVRSAALPCAAAGSRGNAMVDPALEDPVVPARWTAEQYLRLVGDGVLGPDDRVELLEGVIVSMAPQNVLHAASVMRATHVLTLAVVGRAMVRPQLSFVAGEYSVPEPDIAVIAGGLDACDHAHPRDALLVVEVADSSLRQDRLTKAPMYAAAGLPEYWIVNLRDGVLEVRRDPEPKQRRYRSVAVRRRGDVIEPVALPGVRIAVDDLLPGGCP